MKIAIIWAHWVWKTTISKLLWNRLNIEIIPDIVPEAYKLGFIINEDTPIETQIWLTAKQIEMERNLSDFIADKCLMDYYIYWDVLLEDEDVKKVIKKLIDRNAKYDHIFYIPIEFPIEDDWLRSLNIDFQRAIDKRYVKFLEESWLMYHEIKWSIEERISKIYDILKI